MPPRLFTGADRHTTNHTDDTDGAGDADGFD
jgi:hypothetical protein